jgi:hypothetical protein
LLLKPSGQVWQAVAGVLGEVSISRLPFRAGTDVDTSVGLLARRADSRVAGNLY